MAGDADLLPVLYTAASAWVSRRRSSRLSTQRQQGRVSLRHFHSL